MSLFVSICFDYLFYLEGRKEGLVLTWPWRQDVYPLPVYLGLHPLWVGVPSHAHTWIIFFPIQFPTILNNLKLGYSLDNKQGYLAIQRYGSWPDLCVHSFSHIYWPHASKPTLPTTDKAAAWAGAASVFQAAARFKKVWVEGWNGIESNRIALHPSRGYKPLWLSRNKMYENRTSHNLISLLLLLLFFPLSFMS